MRVAFELMRVERNNSTIKRMARLLEVSRSGFCARLRQNPSERAVRTEQIERIEQKVVWFHGGSDEVSGSPKILAGLREDGEIISRETVAKVMKRNPAGCEHQPERPGRSQTGHRVS